MRDGASEGERESEQTSKGAGYGEGEGQRDKGGRDREGLFKRAEIETENLLPSPLHM